MIEIAMKAVVVVILEIAIIEFFSSISIDSSSSSHAKGGAAILQ